MQFLVNIDLAKNELQNVVIHKFGGTLSGMVVGQIYYDSSANKLKYQDNVGLKTIIDSGAGVTAVTATSPLASSGGTTPDISIGSTIGVSLGGTGATSLTIHGIILGQGSNALTSKVLTDGQLLIGVSGADPTATTLSQVTGRTTITSAAGSITIDVNSTQFPSSILADAGKALVASGAGSAAWGNLGVGGGGTGKTSVTLNAFLLGAGGSAALTEIGPLSNGQVIIGATGGAPAAATITGTTNRLGVVIGPNTITLDVNTAQFPSSLLGDAGKALVASGANAAAWGTLGVAGGGTGAVSLTQYGVLIGAGTSAIAATAAGTTGQVLVANTGANPSWASFGGDTSGAPGSLTVNSVNVASYAQNTAINIADAVSKRHTQNTDTGTTSATFQINSGASGVKLKDVSGVLHVRNAADGDDANLQAKDIVCQNLTVNGTMTVIHSTDLSIGDNIITLNEDIVSDAGNTDAGVAICRLDASVNVSNCANNGSGLIRVDVASSQTWQTGDKVRIDGVTGTTEANNTTQRPFWVVTRISGTQFDLQGSTFANAYISGGTVKLRIDSMLHWNETDDRWESRVGSYYAPTTCVLSRKFSTGAFGDNVNNVFTFTHNLNSLDVQVEVMENSGNYPTVVADIERTSLNAVRITFASIPATNSKRAVIIG